MQCKIKPFDLRNNNSFQRRRVDYIWHGTASVSYLGPKMRNLVPTEIEESESLNAFKFKIKKWVHERCLCKICKVNLEQALREKCPNMELFLVRIQSECAKIRTRSYSVFGQFSRSEVVFTLTQKTGF